MTNTSLVNQQQETHIRAMINDEKPSPTPPETAKPETTLPKEIGGPKGPEPTRYGDWEQKGRCTDF
jgi:hypothetical protein